jgi:hypothetical protein
VQRGFDTASDMRGFGGLLGQFECRFPFIVENVTGSEFY